MASGDTLCVWTPQMAELPTTAYPTYDVRNGALVLDFDDTTDEHAEFAGFMPRHYAATTGVTLTIGWMAETATSNSCNWEVAFKSVTDDADDLDTKAFAAANTVTATTASASGEVDYATITFTDGVDMDSVAAGEYFRLDINRDATGDSLVDDAELVFMELRET